MLQNNFDKSGGPTSVPDYTQPTSVSDHTRGGSFFSKPTNKPKNFWDKLGNRFKKAGQGKRLRTANTDKNLGKAHSIKGILKRKKSSTVGKNKLRNLSQNNIEWISSKIDGVLKKHTANDEAYLTRKEVKRLNREAYHTYKKDSSFSKQDYEDFKNITKVLKRGGEQAQQTRHILNTGGVNTENSRTEESGSDSNNSDFQTGYQFGSGDINKKTDNESKVEKPDNVIDFKDSSLNQKQEENLEENSEEELKDMAI